MALEKPKFGLPSDKGGKDLGIFMPIANGGWIMSKNAPKIDASFEYNKQAAVLADKLGLDFVMSMAKWRGYGGDIEHWKYSLDAQILMAAIGEATERVKVWTTVHTFLQNPAVTAKMIATLDHVTGGRSGLNIVTGSYKGEFDQMGAWKEGIDHDRRYDYADEWIDCIKRLWMEEGNVSHSGEFFRLEDCESYPKPLLKPRPFLVCAGTSPRGMKFASEQADALFVLGRNDEELAQISKDAKAKAAEAGTTLKTYTMMTLVMEETDEAAQKAEQYYTEGLDEGALKGMLRAYGFLDSEMGKENAFVASARSSFMTTRSVGSVERVAERLESLFETTDLDGLMLIFPDYLEGIPMFTSEILPRLRARFPEKDLTNA